MLEQPGALSDPEPQVYRARCAKEKTIQKQVRPRQAQRKNYDPLFPPFPMLCTLRRCACTDYGSVRLKETKINITRIARGLPMGGEIEYVDAGTLAQSLVERKKLI